MNDPFVPTPMAMTSLEGFASSGMMTAHDVSEDESEENNYGDVSKILHHLDKEQFSDDSFHLESNELSLSSLDFNLEDDSMEPTPIRPDGIPSVDPQNAFRAFLAPTISNNNTIFAPLNMFPYLPMTTTGKRDFSMMYMPSSTSRVHFDPRRSTVLSYSHDDDLNSCFIRPSKIARMVSSPSFSRAALDIQNRFGSIPEKRAMPSPTGGKAMCNITATAGFSIDDNSAPSGKRAMSLKDPAPKRPKSGDCSEEADEQSEEETGRFRVYQSDQWKERFADLQAYKKRFGNCVVPHNYLHNGSPALVRKNTPCGSVLACQTRNLTRRCMTLLPFPTLGSMGEATEIPVEATHEQ